MDLNSFITNDFRFYQSSQQRKFNGIMFGMFDEILLQFMKFWSYFLKTKIYLEAEAVYAILSNFFESGAINFKWKLVKE